MTELEMRLKILRELRNPSKEMIEPFPNDFILKWQAAIDIAIAQAEAQLPRKDFSCTPPPATIGVRS